MTDLRSWQSIVAIFAITSVIRKPIFTLYPAVSSFEMPTLTTKVSGRCIPSGIKHLTLVLAVNGIRFAMLCLGLIAEDDLNWDILDAAVARLNRL